MGTRLGSHEIGAEVGTGGRREVSKARDTRLNRSGAGKGSRCDEESEVVEVSEIVARVPERHKKIGVSYAVTDDGVELPVIDITHPAFAIHISPEELSSVADRTLQSLKRSAKMPRLVQRLLRRRSILIRQTLESSGGYLSGMATYHQKLGPGNLGRG